jgi:hypothetical protein
LFNSGKHFSKHTGRSIYQHHRHPRFHDYGHQGHRSSPTVEVHLLCFVHTGSAGGGGGKVIVGNGRGGAGMVGDRGGDCW